MTTVETDCVHATNLEAQPKLHVGIPVTLMDILCSESPLMSGRTTPAFLSFKLAS